MWKKVNTKFFVLLCIVCDVWVVLVCVVLVVLIISGWLSLVERKVLAHVGVRVGPGVCGVVGVLTPVCDGLKLALCGVVWVVGLEIWVSVVRGVVMFWVVGLVWCVVPLGVIVVCDVVFSFWSLVGLDVCVGIVVMVLVGWCIVCVYSWLGCIRWVWCGVVGDSVWVCLILVVCGVCGCCSGIGWFGVVGVVVGGVLYLPIGVVGGVCLWVVVLVVIIFDSFRLPWDVVECESELVCGVCVEFCGLIWGVWCVWETQHCVMMCCVGVCLVLGGEGICIKSLVVWFIVVCGSRCVMYRLRLVGGGVCLGVVWIVWCVLCIGCVVCGFVWIFVC